MAHKILIIDDEPRNILALSATLRARGFVCLTANSAMQGMEQLAVHDDVQLVLMDMMMPDMDGYKAIPELKKEYEIPVIAVTAQAMLGDREKCITAGADEYIPKPIDVDRLLKVMNKWIK